MLCNLQSSNLVYYKGNHISQLLWLRGGGPLRHRRVNDQKIQPDILGGPVNALVLM